MLCPRICSFIVINHDLFDNRADSLKSKRIFMRTYNLMFLTTSDTEGEVGAVELV